MAGKLQKTQKRDDEIRWVGVVKVDLEWTEVDRVDVVDLVDEVEWLSASICGWSLFRVNSRAFAVTFAPFA